MEKSHQKRSCFNCDKEIRSEPIYCPNCGQKVDNNNLSLKAVLTEFYENYLSFDTRLGRSVVPFLFQPGTLTKRFIKGKRVSFVNPFRFYLIVSIFFFFTLGLLVEKQLNVSTKGVFEVGTSAKDGSQLDRESFNELAQVLDSVEMENEELSQEVLDSLLKEKGLDQVIKVEKDKSKTSSTANTKLFTERKQGYGFNLNVSKFKVIDKYKFDEGYSDRQLLDSLGADVDSLSDFKQLMALQAMKLYRSDKKIVMRFILGNLSFALLFLIPLLALLFNLFFYKSRMLFVEHLIHSVHLHTFTLFVYALSFLLIYYLSWSQLLWGAFLISAIYLIVSVFKIYKRKVISSLIRIIGVGFSYYVIWVIVLGLSVSVSFLVF